MLLELWPAAVALQPVASCEFDAMSRVTMCNQEHLRRGASIRGECTPNPLVNTLGVAALLGVSTVSQALTCAPQHLTLEEAYQAADSIIVGLISECAEEANTGLWVSGGRDCWFSTVEVLKDALPARDYSGVASSTACGLSLLVGQQYLLFLDRDDQPMRFSASLDGDLHQGNLAKEHLRILRDFKNGLVRDLAEPWVPEESNGGCSIWQSVRGNVIRFSRRTAGVPQKPEIDWTTETLHGSIVYRAAVPIYETDSKSPYGVGEIVAFDELPDPDASLRLSVTLTEMALPPVRRAVINVGDKTWPLHRLEISFAVPHVSMQHKIVEYYATGELAEQVLSAITHPASIVVTATLLASGETSPPSETAPPALEHSSEPYFGPVPDPRAGTGASPAAPDTTRTGAYDTAQGPPPEPILRVETRSTQIVRVIQSFKTCG